MSPLLPGIAEPSFPWLWRIALGAPGLIAGTDVTVEFVKEMPTPPPAEFDAWFELCFLGFYSAVKLMLFWVTFVTTSGMWVTLEQLRM